MKMYWVPLAAMLFAWAFIPLAIYKDMWGHAFILFMNGAINAPFFVFWWRER